MFPLWWIIQRNGYIYVNEIRHNAICRGNIIFVEYFFQQQFFFHSVHAWINEKFNLSQIRVKADSNEVTN